MTLKHTQYRKHTPFGSMLELLTASQMATTLSRVRQPMSLRLGTLVIVLSLT
jgi:hypothetical protein